MKHLDRRQFLQLLTSCAVLPFVRLQPSWTLDDLQYAADYINHTYNVQIDELYMCEHDALHCLRLQDVQRSELRMQGCHVGHLREVPLTVPEWHIPEGTIRMLRHGNTGEYESPKRPMRTWLYHPATRTFVGYEEKG